MSLPVKPKKRIVFNPIEGDFNIITDNNFSYESVPAAKKLIVPANNQMIVYEEFVLELDAELVLDGSLIMEQ